MTFSTGNKDGPQFTLCGMASIPASQCKMGFCDYTFNWSETSSGCQNTNSDVVNVNVCATNLLGNGLTNNASVGKPIILCIIHNLFN